MTHDGYAHKSIIWRLPGPTRHYSAATLEPYSASEWSLPRASTTVACIGVLHIAHIIQEGDNSGTGLLGATGSKGTESDHLALPDRRYSRLIHIASS